MPANTWPTDVSVGEGALWVLSCDRCSDRQVTGATAVGRLLKIDPRDGRVLRVVSVANPGTLATGAGAVWITNFWANTVTRVDPRTMAVKDVISLRLPFAVAPGDRAFVPEDVAVGQGAVWVSTDRGVVARIDPVTDSVTHITTLPPKVGGSPATGAGAVWVGDELAGIYRIDPASGRIVGTTPISRGRLRMSVGEVVVAAKAVWAIGDWARPQADFDRTDYVSTNRWGLVRLDPQTGAVTDTVSVRPQSALVAGPGGAWVVHGGTSLQQIRRAGSGLRVLTTSLDVARFLSFDGRALLVLRDDGTVQRLAFRDLFESPASVRPAPHCAIRPPPLVTKSDSLSRLSGRPGERVVISGPTLRTEDWRYAPASFVEVVWNTNVAVPAGRNPPPITPGSGLLAREPILGRCRFHVAFRVPDVRPGRYRVTVLIWHEPPSEGYGEAGVEHFRVTG